jgi:hypothetical protein
VEILIQTISILNLTAVELIIKSTLNQNPENPQILDILIQTISILNLTAVELIIKSTLN